MHNSVDLTYCTLTNTLTILKSTGYASAIAASLPLHTITTLHDSSSSSTPATFQLPALLEEYFSRPRSPPPEFQLPKACKLYAQLRCRDSRDEDGDSQPIAALDVALPWLSHPNIEALHCSMLSTSSISCSESTVKHLRLVEGESFTGALPNALESFVLDFKPFDGENEEAFNIRQKIDLAKLVRALPRTLKFLALDIMKEDVDENGGRTVDLKGLGQLRMICVWCIVLPEDMVTVLPHGLENFSIDVFYGKYASSVGEQLLKVFK